MLGKKYVKSRKISKVTFQLAKSEVPEGSEVESVHLVGDFNGWDEQATPMKYNKRHKAYRVTLELSPGRQYLFRYLINGELWCNDWAADAYTRGDFGQDNCVVITPTAEG